MNNRTKVALGFLGNLLLLVGFFFLPWYVAPVNTHGNLLEGPSAWNIMTLPFVAQTLPDPIGFVWIIPFWLLAALIIFELIREFWKLSRNQVIPIKLNYFYQISIPIGLICIVIIFIISCFGFAGFGWRSILINLSGLGFWFCLIGFFLNFLASQKLSRETLRF